MADYYHLIAQAVAHLGTNADVARRAALYECARTSLVTQLFGLSPPLAESEITRERLLLEEAIRTIEATTTQPLRIEAASPIFPSKLSERPRQEPPSPEQGASAAAGRELSSDESRPRPESGAHGLASQTGGRACDRASLSAEAVEALRVFREGVAEAERLSEAETPTRQVCARPGNIPGRGRLEPGIERYDQRTLSRPMMPRAGDVGMRRPQLWQRIPKITVPKRPGRSRNRLLAVCLGPFLLLAGVAHWQRDRFSAAFGTDFVIPAQYEAAPPQPENLGSLGQVSQPGFAAADQTPPAWSDGLVGPRAVLYEEDPADPAGKRYVGSVIWQMEPMSSEQPRAVRAQIEIPERHLGMTMSLRRNTEKALPASHVVEIMFKLPADFQFGGISNVPSVLMKETEQARGEPLAGLSVKVTTGVFLIGLSATESEAQRNRELLDGRSWFDIPIVYGNGRRAILAIEKDKFGEGVLKQVFAAGK